MHRTAAVTLGDLADPGGHRVDHRDARIDQGAIEVEHQGLDGQSVDGRIHRTLTILREGSPQEGGLDMHLTTHTLPLADGLPLRLDLRRHPEQPARATVIVVHGFKGFKRWGFFPYVGERLARAGIASIVFDFSLNGIGDAPEEFTRLDLFARNTYSRELDDLGRVLTWLREDAPPPLRALPLGLLGHSRGALPVVVAAAERDDIAAVVTWNGVGHALRHTDKQLERWEEEGEMEFTNARTGQRMSMLYDFVVDARENAARFDLSAAARRMRAPHLILHGTRDMAVPLEESESLRAGRGASEGCSVVRIEGGTHTFGAVHPFAGTTPALEQALEHTLRWFEDHAVS